MFTTISTPVAVSSEPDVQRARGMSPTKRSVPGPRKRTAVEGPLVEEGGPLTELRDVCAPGGDRIVLVEPGGGRDGVPEPLDVGLAEHGLRPAGVRVTDDRPRDLAVTGRLQHLLGDELGPRLGDAGRIEVGEELGLGVAGDRNQGSVRLRELLDERERPRRRPLERVLRRVDDPRPADVWIGIERLDVPGAALVGDLGDRPDQGQMIRMPGDTYELAGLEVDPDLHGEAGVACESLLGSHSSAAYTGGRSFSRTSLRCHGSVPAVLLTITTTGKVTLLIVAGLFIAWALITAIWIPKRNPDFPATLTVFLLVSSLFLVAQLGAVYWVTSTQEVETEAAEPPGESTPAETTPAETNPGNPQPGADADVVAGKEVFESAGCVGCHTLADAGATGTVGPNLDEAKPPHDLVVTRVTNGMGAMPPFKGQLSEKQIQDVAAYVSSVAGKS